MLDISFGLTIIYNVDHCATVYMYYLHTCSTEYTDKLVSSLFHLCHSYDEANLNAQYERGTTNRAMAMVSESKNLSQLHMQIIGLGERLIWRRCPTWVFRKKRKIQPRIHINSSVYSSMTSVIFVLCYLFKSFNSFRLLFVICSDRSTISMLLFFVFIQVNQQFSICCF